MILFNQAIKHNVNAEARKLLKSILKERRRQFCDDEVLNISFKYESPNSWFTDKGMNYVEWQVMTVFHIEMGLWKKEDQEDWQYNWYYGYNN